MQLVSLVDFNKKPRRNWSLIIGISIMLVMLGSLIAYMIIPPLLTYERLALLFYGFTSNSTGQIKQAVFNFWNNGTRSLTVKIIWINGTVTNSSEYRADVGGFTDEGIEISPRIDKRVYIAHETFVFVEQAYYNFTVGTTSGNHYTLIVKCDNTSASPENLTVLNWDFVPSFGSDYPAYIGFRYRNYGSMPIIITSVYLNGAPADTNLPLPQWTWSSQPGATIIDYDWLNGQTCDIIFTTAVGNTYELLLTAPTS